MSYPVYCINLIHRTDRKKNAEEQFKILNIDNVIYPVFTKDKRGGAYGCYDSHMKIWKDFYEKYPNIDYCLIFEDDFVSTENSSSYIKSAVEYIKEYYNDIDIVNLHNFFIPVDNKINNDLFSNGYGFTTNAYFITRHYIDKISKNGTKFPEPDGSHIDLDINEDVGNILYSEKIFFTKNICFIQLEDESDNDWGVFDSIRKLGSNTTLDFTKKLMIFIKKFGISDNFIKQSIVDTVSAIITVIIYILIFIIIIMLLFKR